MKILEFPELRQIYNYDCGACAATSVLAYYGFDVREEAVWGLADITKDGTDPSGILRVFEHFKLATIAYCGMDPNRIRQAIDRGYPVILDIQAWRDNDSIEWATDWNDGHFVCAIGYDSARLIFEDPASYKRTWLTDGELLTRWRDKDVNGNEFVQWGCIVLGTPKFKAGAMEHCN
jgi:predicted double-glycine peptidase